MQYIQQPQAIEAKSFDIIGEIINETRPEYQFASPLHEAIIKRVIHTTADFDWLDILWFSDDALEQLCAALSRPSVIYTDTTMALSGINKTLLAKTGGECRCYISDPRVVAQAKAGFVGAVESKEALTHSQLPAIAALGRKGGSNVAAAIVNAMLYYMQGAR